MYIGNASKSLELTWGRLSEDHSGESVTSPFAEKGDPTEICSAIDFPIAFLTKRLVGSSSMDSDQGENAVL